MSDIVEYNLIEKSYFIGFSNDKAIRYKSSSGGIGSNLIKYLLESKKFGTSITFAYNNEKFKYEPQLIYDFKDYNNCGSVYQDIDLISFIKNNVKSIKNGIVVTCMPCQVRPIRSILKRNDIEHFIISLCCSGQTTLEGTWLYYKLLGLKKENVKKMQYRGNGWPSGIQIELKNGDFLYRDNYTNPWRLIHESLLYRPPRCFYCAIKTNEQSDVSLADPWLKEYTDNDKIGNSIVICNQVGASTIKEMVNAGVLSLEEISESIYIKSQHGTIALKAVASKNTKFNKFLVGLGREKSLYKRMVTSSERLLKVHVFMLRLYKKILK